VLEDIRKSSH